MGRILDFLLTGSWEEYQRVQLYKNIGKGLTKEEFKEKVKELIKDEK